MFLKALEQRGIESTIGDASAFGRWLIEQQGGLTPSGVKVTENTALTLPYAYACINVLSQSLAHLPIELVKEETKGPRLATKHRLFNIARFTPSGKITSYDWKETLEGHRNGWGNSYCEIVRDGPFPTELPVLLPDRTEPMELKVDGSIVYQTVRRDHQRATIPAADVLHFSGLGFDGIRGYSPVALAREALGLGLAIQTFGGTFFGNGMSPKSIIESDQAPNTLAPFLEEFKKQYGSLEQANGTPVLPKGMTYKPVVINPDDAQTLETANFNRTVICGFYRVPPTFVMDLSKTTFTNASQMDLHFVKHTMIPIITNWESELNAKLLTESERRRGFHFKFDIKGLLRGAQAERFTAYHQALQDGWMNRNEVRVLEGLQEEDGLNDFLTPVNMVDVKETPTDEAPLVDSVAERMASSERRQLERIGDDIDKVSAFYNDYPQFIERNLMPLATAIEDGLDCTAAEFVADFSKRHIDKQLSQMITSVSDLNIEESAIVETYQEVKNARQNS